MSNKHIRKIKGLNAGELTILPSKQAKQYNALTTNKSIKYHMCRN